MAVNFPRSLSVSGRLALRALRFILATRQRDRSDGTPGRSAAGTDTPLINPWSGLNSASFPAGGIGQSRGCSHLGADRRSRAGHESATPYRLADVGRPTGCLRASRRATDFQAAQERSESRTVGDHPTPGKASRDVRMNT
jgi:hypothetical protein